MAFDTREIKTTLSKCFFIFLIFILLPSCAHSLGKEDLRVGPLNLGSVFRRLDTAGFDPGPIREDDLGQLSKAIRRFQKVAKIEETGGLDDVTLEKLEKLYDPEGAQLLPGKANTGKIAGPSVHWPQVIVNVAQELLKRLGYDPGNIDGVLKPKTEEAVREFQKNFGIDVKAGLDKKTMMAILQQYCENGCSLSVRMTASDIRDVAAIFSDDATSYSGTILELVYVYALQTALNEIGYDSGRPDGIIEKKTKGAIRRFQKKHQMKATGDADRVTATAIFLECCPSACTFQYEREVDNTPIARRIDPKIDIFTYPANPGDRVFAIEKVECSALSGDWLIFYEGELAEKKKNEYSVRLEKRMGYRYHPEKTGFNKTDWYCIPKRRHCYSEIKFSDWKGEYEKGQTVTFPADRVLNAKLKIEFGVSAYLKQTCKK